MTRYVNVILFVMSLLLVPIIGLAQSEARSQNTVKTVAEYSPQYSKEHIAYFETHEAHKARENWMLNCQGCHSIDGSGRPDKGLPDLRASVSNFLNVEGGREYLTRVPGVTNSFTNDADLAELLNWVLITFDPEHLPKGFVPFTEKEIANGRAKPLATKADHMRNDLLKALQNKNSKN